MTNQCFYSHHVELHHARVAWFVPLWQIYGFYFVFMFSFYFDLSSDTSTGLSYTDQSLTLVWERIPSCQLLCRSSCNPILRTQSQFWEEPRSMKDSSSQSVSLLLRISYSFQTGPIRCIMEMFLLDGVITVGVMHHTIYFALSNEIVSATSLWINKSLFNKTFKTLN